MNVTTHELQAKPIGIDSEQTDEHYDLLPLRGKSSNKAFPFDMA